jgi:hypothetical protein
VDTLGGALPLLVFACLSLTTGGIPALGCPARTSHPLFCSLPSLLCPSSAALLFLPIRDDWACVYHDGMRHVRMNTSCEVRGARCETRPATLPVSMHLGAHNVSGTARGFRPPHQREIAILDAHGSSRVSRRLSPDLDRTSWRHRWVPFGARLRDPKHLHQCSVGALEWNKRRRQMYIRRNR